jgi:UDP-N-acetylmuramoylalanine--D-glutamate ligase
MENTNHYINRLKSLQENRKNALAMFSGIGHRLEAVATINGVEIINDSKSTDLNSTLHSVELIEKPLTWIAGTSEYEEDYSVFLKQVKYKVVNLVVFGKNDLQIRNTLGVFADRYIYVDNIQDALLHAMKFTPRGGVVLFSPACTSFEMFSDYRERGMIFKELVNGLK